MREVPRRQLGPYEMVAVVGAGSMGEVYRARDPRLGRDVAIKVLPPDVAADEDRVRRFEIEARAAGLLNHPNILAIYDVGTDDGRPYVVTELLEGESLRDRLRAGPLPVRKALDFAAQMARGLAAAHAKGIAHRDLKPENVFVTREGRIKILDFGLAKLTEPPDPLRTTAPTGLVGTAPGVVLGTVGYMAPEQVRGQAADGRADIFSLGVVLHEMLSGQRAFGGDSAPEVMTAILREEPPPLTERVAVPAALDRLVQHCLEKNPDERFQSAQDLVFNLEALVAPSDTTVSPLTRIDRPWRRHASAAALALVALTAAFAAGRLTMPAPAEPRLQVQRLTDLVGLEEAPAISPDGRAVAFSAQVDGSRQIFVRLIAGGAPLQVTSGAGEHLLPRWSPDSTAILYYTHPPAGQGTGALAEVSALGGPSRRIVASLGGGDISHDGRRVAFFRATGEGVELVVAARDGSGIRAVARFERGAYFLHPRWSPDDRFISFQQGYIFDHDIFVVSSAGGEPRQVTRENTMLSGYTWREDGSGLVFSSARDTTVFYLPTFNLWEVDLDGSALRRVTASETSYLEPDIRAGRLVASRMRMQFDLWRYPVDHDPADNVRHALQVTRQTGHVQTPSAGPDDREVVYLSDSGGHGNLWVVTLETGAIRQITFETDPAVRVGVPVWSPDGSRIAFFTNRDTEAQGGNWTVSPDGSNLRQLARTGGWAAWSADGRRLYYADLVMGEIWKMPAEGGDPVLVRTDSATRPALSPDGGTLYYTIELPAVSGGADYEIRAAEPEDGPSRVLARIPATRIPGWQLVHPVISPDGRWLSLPLTDGVTTNIWLLSTETGDLQPVTDFGDRATFIARRLSWSTDGRYIFAAVGEGDADIVLIDGFRTGR
jgi:eukaryotic-like serine/threonine-protein kinase